MIRAAAGWRWRWRVNGRRLQVRTGHPFAGVVALRARELARRPVVVAAFALQGTAVAATLSYGALGAACALVLRGALAGVVALLAWGLVGELVLAPRCAPASGWTVWTSAARLAGQGTTPLSRAVLVVVLALGLALGGCLATYARRQVRD